jgi:hypothetical protein
MQRHIYNLCIALGYNVGAELNLYRRSNDSRWFWWQPGTPYETHVVVDHVWQLPIKGIVAWCLGSHNCITF